MHFEWANVCGGTNARLLTVDRKVSEAWTRYWRGGCNHCTEVRKLERNTGTDVIGVEMFGALKNVLAIAAGIVEGLELGNNAMAVLVAQGCGDWWLAGKLIGCKERDFSWFGGTYDIMLTCFVNLSRNRTVGSRLGGGNIRGNFRSMNQVAEGVATAGPVVQLAKKHRVSLPVLTAVARILEGDAWIRKTRGPDYEFTASSGSITL